MFIDACGHAQCVLPGRKQARLARAAKYCGSMLLATALGLLASTAWALPADRPLTEFTLDRFDSRHGLPDNMVMAIAQTRDGYMWFGTWEGLARFNGHEFVLFDRSNTPALERHAVRALAADAAGNLWVGTARGGLLRLSAEGEWQRWQRSDGSLPFDDVMGVRVGADLRVWVASETAGLVRLDLDGRVHRFDLGQGLSSGTVFDLLTGADGMLWVATSAGLDRIDRDGQIQAFGVAHGLPAGEVRGLALDSAGRLRASVGGRVYALSEQRFIEVVGGSASAGSAYRLYADAAGALWLGSNDRGLLRASGGHLEQLDVSRGLAHNRVLALLEDDGGSMWIGTSAGVQRLRQLPFATLGSNIDLISPYVRSLFEDAAGALWIGSAGGLARLDAAGLQQWTRAEGLLSESVLSVAGAADGALLIGTYGAGLVRLHGQTIAPLARSELLAQSQVRALLRGNDGSLWVGSNHGLLRLRGDEVRLFTDADGLPRPYVLSLAMDAQQRLLVGTSNGFARQSADDRFEAFTDAQGFAARDVFAITVRDDGRVWFATDGSLLRWREGQFSKVAEAQGLPFRSWFTLLDDGRGHAWLSSNRGIVQVAWDALEGAADDPAAQVAIREYDQSDGLANRQANGGSQGAGIRRADGSLWFATAEGVARIDPDPSARPTMLSPRPMIESVIADGKRLTRRSPIPLGTRRIEIRFAGLQLKSAERVRYRYRLLGFDDDWSADTRERSASYTNLAPGSYRFEMEASLAELPRLAPAVIAFDISPLWYQRGVVWLLGSVLLIGLVALWLRQRLAADGRRQAELEAMVSARTADLAEQTLRLATADRDKSALLEQLQERSAAFARQAREDALTGLPNRRAFDLALVEAFEHARANGEPLALAIADIDSFKQINDNHSHAAGDAVLRAVGQRLANAAPAATLIARIGGEEYAVLMPGRGLLQARTDCERLRQLIAERPVSDGGVAIAVTISMGVAALDDEIGSTGRLLSLADQRLYAAKRGGRNRVE